MPKQAPLPRFALTTAYEGIVNVLPVQIGIGEYRSGEQEPAPQKTDVRALWDTGAQGSVITRQLAVDLGLVSIGKKRVYGATGNDMRDKYLVNIFLPSGVGYPGIMVTECEDLVGGFQALIGMDIIASGDFALTSKDGKTILTFQVPSTHHLDFYGEINRQSEQLRRNKTNRGARQAYEAAHRKKKRK